VTTDKKAANGTPEILIGNTNRAASETAKGKLSQYYDFTIDVGEKTIAIYANTNKRLEDAVKYFNKNVKASKDKVYYTLTENYVDIYKGLHPNAAIDDNMLKDYKIVLPADANEIQKNAASTLALVLEEECGSVIPVIYDSEPATNLEILLGKTNRPESEYPSDTNDRLFASGSKIVVAPSTDEGYSRLINMLQKEFSLRSGRLKGSAIKVNSLSYAAIKSISFGAVNISEQPDGLRFNKFSQKQIEEWTMFNRYNEASGSTGIRLDFYTDSSSFYFRGIAGKKFELFVNGESVKISSDGYIEAELDNIPNEKVRQIAKDNLDKIANGIRDFRF
jgi:2-iminoacetate synthase